jgi:hypothetical protein
MNKLDLVELIIRDRTFRDIGFSKLSLKTYTQSEELKDELFHEIVNIKSCVELTCDRLRTLGNSTQEHFVKLLNEKYQFSNDLVYGELYDYGMLVTR